MNYGSQQIARRNVRVDNTRKRNGEGWLKSSVIEWQRRDWKESKWIKNDIRGSEYVDAVNKLTNITRGSKSLSSATP
jgi:hypothetical protein